MNLPGIPRPEGEDAIRAWEEESLADLRAMTATSNAWQAQHPDAEILDVGLRGRYPDTEIVVRYRHHWKKIASTRGYKLWGSSFEAPAGIEPPSQVALLIHTWVMEG